MSIRQDRLTFFGVLIAVVIAVLGYLQLGSMYPVEGRAQDPGVSRGDEAEPDVAEKNEAEKGETEEKIRETDHTPAPRLEDAAP